MSNAKYAPGTVTPAQLEQYRQAYEAAQAREQRAYIYLERLIDAYGEMMAAYEEAALDYLLAQKGMVRVDNG